MAVESARFTNAGKTRVDAVIDGATWSGIDLAQTSDDRLARRVKAWINEGNTPAPFVAQPVTPLTIDEIYDQALLTQKVLKAVILALNDGTLSVGTNKTGAQIKTIIKAKMNGP